MPHSDAPTPHAAMRLALLAAMIIAGALLAAPDFPRKWADIPHYIAMAQGLPDMLPWAGRILLPGMVVMLSNALGLSMDASFKVINCAVFVVWLALVARMWRPSIWLPAFLLLPLVVGSLQTVYITDLFHMGLTAVFIVLLRSNVFAAAAFMPFMMMGRENSMFLAFIAIGLLLWNRKYAGAAAMFAGYAVGFVIVHAATRGLENVHKMPEFLYLIFKMPSNFLRNFLDVQLWTNGYAWCDNPVVTFTLPGGMHLGAITSFGFCSPSIVAPLAMASDYATGFGVLPAVLLAVMLSRGVPRALWRAPWWSTAFGYGLLMLLLAPFAGKPVDRDIGFAWTLFLIALPAISAEMLTWRLALLNVAAAWAPVLWNGILSTHSDDLSFIGVSTEPVISALALAVGIVANVLAYRLVRGRLARAPAPPALAVVPG
jgi:hypothetical protein